MRPDIHKVIVERPRRGGIRDNRKWGQRLSYMPESDYEDETKFVSASASRQYADPKDFSDFLSPLTGLLRKNLGRPWDKVNGELRRGIDTRTAREGTCSITCAGWSQRNASWTTIVWSATRYGNRRFTDSMSTR